MTTKPPKKAGSWEDDDSDTDNDSIIPKIANSAQKSIETAGGMSVSAIFQSASKEQIKRREAPLTSSEQQAKTVGRFLQKLSQFQNHTDSTTDNLLTNDTELLKQQMLEQVANIPTIPFHDTQRNAAVSSNSDDGFIVSAVNFADLPPEPDFSDFSAIGVDAFGFGVLLGQGYIPGDGVGRSNKTEVKPVDLLNTENTGGHKAGLNFGTGTWGLGADASTVAKKQALKAMEKSGLLDEASVDTEDQKNNTSAHPPAIHTNNFPSANTIQHEQRTHNNDGLVSTEQDNTSKESTFPRLYWAQERLHVKITNRNNRHYSHKGVIDRISERTGEIIVVIDDTTKSSRSLPVETRIASESDLETYIPKCFYDPNGLEQNRKYYRILLLNTQYRDYFCDILSISATKQSATIQVLYHRDDRHDKNRRYVDKVLNDVPLDDLCEYI